MEKIVKEYLEDHNVNYTIHIHPAVFTCEQAAVHCKNIPGTPGKNLFLKSKQLNAQFYLFILAAVKKANLNAIAEILNVKRLTFGNEQELKEILNLAPGSVSPLGLINDKEKKIIVIIDQEIWNADIVNFHPNINTASVEFTREQFHKLMGSFPHEKKIINVG